jgi:choline dehydrogenase-like flavoprotein
MANIPLDDENAIVVIGSGAGGGTLAHELTRRGIKVVLLEAGARQSTETFSQVPGEAFLQLTRSGPRSTWRRTRRASCNASVWGPRSPTSRGHPPR